MSRLEKNSFILIADVFRISLINGLPCREEMIRWADAELKNRNDAPAWLSDISLSGQHNVNDIITRLDQIVGFNKQLIPARMVIGILFRQVTTGSLRIEKVTQVLAWLSRHSPLTTEEKYIIAGLDDKLQLAMSKTFGEVKEVEREVIRFVTLYQNFSFDSLDDWKGVSENLKKPLLDLFNQVRKEQSEFIDKQRASGWKSLWGLWK